MFNKCFPILIYFSKKKKKKKKKYCFIINKINIYNPVNLGNFAISCGIEPFNDVLKSKDLFK